MPEADAPPSPAPAADEVVRTESLRKVYRGDRGSRKTGLTAVEHLDLSVHKGEMFGLLGPNGAGKTTTVGMLTTRVIPTAGTALVNGIDVVAKPAAAKQVIGVVPQLNTLDRSLTVWENLSFHGRYFGMGAKGARARADELLDRFRLGDRRNAEVRALSGGMAQRLQAARALVHNPAVLFLDEPTAGLDPQSRLALWEILGELHDEGQTIFLTTHYMEEADEFCDRVAIMDHGRILALDTPARLKQSAGDGNGARATSVEARLLHAISSSRPTGLLDPSLSVAETAEALSDLYRAAHRLGISLETLGLDVDQLTGGKVTLETVFIGLTGRELRE